MARFLRALLIFIFILAICIAIFYVEKKSQGETMAREESSLDDYSLLLPHLDSAKSERIDFLRKFENFKPSDIIILSTNHFASSENEIIFDDSPWNLATGQILGSNHAEVFSEYENSHDLVVNDHGIRNPIIDLSAKFTTSKFLSFLVKPKSSEETLGRLMSEIEKFCQENNRKCLLVASVDLSHDNQSQIADLHDDFTLSALKKLDEIKIKKAETDSPEVLSLLIRWSKKKNLNNFNLFSRGNTGKQSKNFDNGTTSWIVGDYGSEAIKSQKNTTLMFAGDIMTDRLVNHKFKDSGFDKIFVNFKNRVFAGVDSSIANLEGPISEVPIEDNTETDNLIFNFPIMSIDALKSVGFSGFTLSNNHTLNDSNSGLERTRKILNDKGLYSFGSPSGIDNYSLHRIESDIAVSVIGINQLSSLNENDLKSLIKSENEEDRFVIIYPHWGAEYQTSHNNSEQALAYKMIDWGADLVVGSHPHVIQDSEIYKGKLIVYSLGNFIFDQLFSEETQQGVILSLSINEDKIRVGFIPVISRNMQLEILKGEKKQQIFDRIIPASGYLNKGEDGTIELRR
jgi:poly-gamma-glutamate synthesis protein (capsule biosynthesis protein)